MLLENAGFFPGMRVEDCPAGRGAYQRWVLIAGVRKIPRSRKPESNGELLPKIIRTGLGNMKAYGVTKNWKGPCN